VLSFISLVVLVILAKVCFWIGLAWIVNKIPNPYN
jgi:hypothetical protein